MGLFTRRKGQLVNGDVDRIIDLVSARFVSSGVAVEVAEGTAGIDTILLAADGTQYPLYNIITRALALPRDSAEYHEAIDGHVKGLVAAIGNPVHSSLSEAEFEAVVRVRLAHESIRQMLPLSYARPFAGDLIVALCLDTPTTVEYVSDETLEGRDVERLYQVGLANALAEPLLGVQEVAPGVVVLEGESFFTASKAVDFEQLLGSVLPASPYGVVFGVPHRHLIVAHVLSGPESITAIGSVAQLTAMQAGEGAPGGPLSAHLYYWHDGDVEVAGGASAEGAIEIRPSERFMAVLNAIAAV